MHLISNPLVSIIIPTFNRALFLKETLESINKQTFLNYEVIVIDDGSSNDEANKVCEFFEKVSYFKIKNSGGPAKPRNIGIQKAKGKYLAFLDDDDLWLPTKLEKQVVVLENNPDFGLVHGCCEVIDEKGRFQNRIIGRPGSIDVKHGDVSMRMIGNWTIMMPTPLVRKEVIDKVGFFNEEMPPAGEDTEYWTRCSFETQFYYIDEPLVKYRVHATNLSADVQKYDRFDYYIKEVLLDQKKRGKISNSLYKMLLSRICTNQIKYFKKDYQLTLVRLFELDKFWYLRYNNVKYLIYILLFKR